MSLSEKSDEEISELLTEYGIKHGPIVDSTRGLYEKKLEKVMEGAAAKPSPDKTYYREEEEEVTYITYHSPVRHEAYGDTLRQRGNVDTEEEEEEDEESDEETEEPPVQVTHRTANHSAVRSKEPVRKSGGCMWKFIRMLLLIAALAAAYYVYTQVVNNEENTSGIQ
uniref:emerin (Emery-Dreifuss muscular dystrophy) n=1 Tax=Semicossyphus pulcher TaxID=241346 RepID=UPI0037E9C827